MKNNLLDEAYAGHFLPDFQALMVGGMCLYKQRNISSIWDLTLKEKAGVNF